jgi:hypothetical protein
MYAEIAAELGCSTSTVRTHLHNAYRNLKVRDRAQAVLIAVERGWIDGEGSPRRQAVDRPSCQRRTDDSAPLAAASVPRLPIRLPSLHFR